MNAPASCPFRWLSLKPMSSRRRLRQTPSELRPNERSCLPGLSTLKHASARTPNALLHPQGRSRHMTPRSGAKGGCPALLDVRSGLRNWPAACLENSVRSSDNRDEAWSHVCICPAVLTVPAPTDILAQADVDSARSVVQTPLHPGPRAHEGNRFMWSAPVPEVLTIDCPPRLGWIAEDLTAFVVIAQPRLAWVLHTYRQAERRFDRYLRGNGCRAQQGKGPADRSASAFEAIACKTQEQCC